MLKYSSEMSLMISQVIFQSH